MIGYCRFRLADAQIISACFTAGPNIDDDVKAAMLAEAEKPGYDVSDNLFVIIP